VAHLTHNIERFRPNAYGSDEIFRNRWSPRSMTGEPIGDEVLMALFEAAHWAPSSNNNQPWRFIYAHRDGPDWPTFFGLLTERNQVWCENAAVLIVIVSKTTFDHNGKPSRTHSFDTGAAWGMMALQGSLRGLVVHGMQGFDYDRAKKDLGIPDGYEVEAMAAVGILDEPSKLPTDMAKNEYPNQRKGISHLAAKGRFVDAIR